MKTLTITFALAASAWSAFGGAPALGDTVTGTVTYRQRIALTSNAVVQVTLANVSRLDAPAVLIGHQTINTPGQVPIAFRIKYKGSAINTRRAYAVQARITEDGQLRFINTTANLVITQGHPKKIEIVLSPVAVRSIASGDGAADVDHGGLVDVGGEHILTIRAAGDGKTIAQRADNVTERLVPILSETHLTAADIRAVPAGEDWVKIMVKNYLLVTVLPEDARANQTKPLALAQVWVAHLRKVLPLVNSKPNANNWRGR